jgi:hypothetical protein
MDPPAAHESAVGHERDFGEFPLFRTGYEDEADITHILAIGRVLSTKTQNEENRAVMGESCYGPCVLFKNEAAATPLGGV